MANRVTVKDNGLTALQRKLTLSKGLVLTVGIHAAEGAANTPGGRATLAEVAIINEYGLGNVPERSFIRDWFDQGQTANVQAIKAVGLEVVKGTYTAEAGLGRLGALFQGQIQARISGGIPPPNAPATVARKGSSTPLIDTGQLRSSILWKVSKDGDAI